jgi:hypothetical protein
MHSLQQSRGRILFDAVCAFGIAASCVAAWMQTWSTAMLPAAAIAALYGLVRASDMLRREPKVDAPEKPAECIGEPAPAMEEVAERIELPAEVSSAADKKPTRKPRKTAKLPREPEVAEIPADPEPLVAKPEPEPEPDLYIVTSVPDEPEYVPATPLFETEPFVRQQRAAFGRKAR